MNENMIGKKAVQASIDVHRELGPGLLESAYKKCLAFELREAGLTVLEEVPIPVIYKGIELDCGYRIDLLINHKVVIEIKSVKSLEDVHTAQVITYLKLSGCKLGFLINFNESKVKYGLRRLVNGI